MKRWAAFLIVLGAAWAAAAVEVRPAADTQVAPGGYATLLFSVTGREEVELALLAPEGWQVLTLPESLALDGRTPVPVTLRVPELTPAGASYPIILQAWSGDRLLSQAQARVGIKPKADLILYVSQQEDARLGEPISYQVTVINRGNQRDRVLLEAESNTGEAYLRPTALELEPGEEGAATLTLQIGEERRVSPGYVMITWVRARSSRADLVRRVRVSTRWVDPNAAAGGGLDPTLRFALAGSVGLGARVVAGEMQPLTLSYSVQPSLSGELSDYVEASARPSALAGRSPTWWPQGPSSLSLGLKSERWDAALSATPTESRLQTGFKGSGWRYGINVRGRYDLGSGGVAVSAISTRKALNLQLSASTQAAQGTRQDRFSVDYSKPFGESLDLRLGGRISGLSAEGYTLVGSGRQGLLWQGPRFSVLESLTATPQLGLYTLTLTGGSRSVYPIGVRATAHTQLRPEGLGWKTSASLFATPFPRTSFRWTTVAQRPSQGELELSFNPVLGLRPPSWKGLRSRLSLGYTLRWRPEAGRTLQVGTASSQLGYGPLRLDASGSYSLVGAAGYKVALGASWRPLPLTVLKGHYTAQLGEGYSERLGFGWQQYWGAGFASQLDLSRVVEDGTRDRLQFYLAQKSLGGSPFGIVLGYALIDEDGLGQGSSALTQALSVQLGYNFAWRFPTPEPVVDLFGGRRVGRVYGTAFIDDNLNGRFDEGEQPAGGLFVRMGGAETQTGASGEYELRVRPGKQTPELARLPATLDLYRPAELEVREGERYRLDLPLAPTAQLPVVLFHDANHNGVQDEGERGIAYGGVRLVGPTVRSFRTDDRGRTLATGLLPGTYRVEPDPELLPPRFQATAKLAALELEPGKAGPVQVGAAPPPKKVRTTYDAGRLTVFATLPEPIAAAGGEVVVQALAQGRPDRVWATLRGREYALASEDGRTYSARLRLPRSTPVGPLTLEVHAARGPESASTVAIVTVVKRPLYTLEPVKFQVGRAARFKVRLLFRARDVLLSLGSGPSLRLVSEDGYLWTGAWTPEREGAIEVAVTADGEELEPGSITVLPVRTGER